jgi:hypothetical protein
MSQLCNTLNQKKAQSRLLFVEPQAGAGFIQWSLPGEGWIPFSDIDETNKPAVAKEYKTRCDMLRNLFSNAPMLDPALTVPSENEFVFFRQSGGGWEIALTAWGYKYVDFPKGNEISTWFVQEEKQEVNIGFIWNKNLLGDMSFTLNGQARVTALDGLFRVGAPIPVGNQFMLKTLSGQEFQLTVEKGKADYVYDLTQYVQIEVDVKQDNAALPNQSCEVSFQDAKWNLVTDENGHASLSVALACDLEGKTLQPQPVCTVTCGDANQQQVPAVDGETLRFNFTFFTQKYVEIKVSVTKDGSAMTDQPCDLSFNGSDYQLKTDGSGLASVKMPLVVGQDGKVKDPQPECSAICATEVQKARPSANGDVLLFNFVFVTPPDPKFVKIRLLDYGGYPMPDLPFKLTTKKKGEQALRTDENGYCQVPREWFSDKEKMRIKTLISPEYQEKHDLHNKKK